jgi:hypothetical protein
MFSQRPHPSPIKGEEAYSHDIRQLVPSPLAERVRVRGTLYVSAVFCLTGFGSSKYYKNVNLSFGDFINRRITKRW